jgi:HD-like signal output (HDOD) protein/ActR/RegA family two-component response regulator
MPLPLKQILLAGPDDAALAMSAKAGRQNGLGWVVSTVYSGNEALTLLDQASFDLVIASMVLPGMSGLDLLRATMVRHPHTVRVLLLDRPETELMLGSVGIAHQYLVKPCAADDLLQTVCRLLALDQFFTSDPLRRVVARIQQLPSPPTIYFRLMQELARSDATTGKVGEIISQDASLTAKLLQLANSAFFALPRPVMSVPEAVQIIGFNLVKSLSLSLGLFASLNSEAIGEYSSDRLYLHSLATGLLAQRILSDEGAESAIVDAAFTAGVLHDTGKLVLASALPELYHHALQLASDELIPQWQAEANVFGVSHAEIGAYLLGLWGLPPSIVEAVAWHHQPRRREPPAFGALAAVHIADYLQSRHLPASRRPLVVQIDEPYIQSLHLIDRIGQWEEAAGRL